MLKQMVQTADQPAPSQYVSHNQLGCQAGQQQLAPPAAPVVPAPPPAPGFLRARLNINHAGEATELWKHYQNLLRKLQQLDFLILSFTAC